MNDYIDFNTYKVYVKTDENGIITAVNSSAFLADVTGWTEIDEGVSDKYHHAQNNYLDKGLVDSNGIFNYLLIGGEPVLLSEEHNQTELDSLNAQAEIAELKAKLAATDYIAAKLAEGAATREDYAEEIAHRAQWRAEINRLEDV